MKCILFSSGLELKDHHDDLNGQILQFEQTLRTVEDAIPAYASKEEYRDLQNNLRTIREMIVQADTSNTELHRHTTTILEHLNILTSPLEDLEKTLPIISELNGSKRFHCI